jgi:glycosyltransferase involved in cell wall biosynthesis
MTILLDCRALQGNYAHGGIGTYVRNLYPQLLALPSAQPLTLCGYPHPPLPLKTHRYHTLHRPALRPWLWEQLLWPLDIMRTRASLLYMPVVLGPLRNIALPLLARIPCVATVQDLTCLRIPAYAPVSRTHSFALQRKALRNAARVVTLSDAVKHDVVDWLGVAPEKITVIPAAVDSELASAFERFEKLPPVQTHPFVLAMGEELHKNIVTVLEVYRILLARGYAGNLVIVGRRASQTPHVLRWLQNHAPAARVRFTERIDTSQLVALYAACDCFLFPSLAEGFGFPVLEAQYCAAAVVTSSTTALPQTAGAAALLGSPHEPEQLAHLVAGLLDDSAARSALRQKARLHARSFSWQQAAQRLGALFTEING